MKKNKTIFFGILFLICISTAVYARGEKDSSTLVVDLPQRIVSLSPSATEILFAVGAGDKIIARTDFCNYPEKAQEITAIGGFDRNSISLEAIIAQKPDLVYAKKSMHGYLEEALTKYGITVYMSVAESIEAIFAEIEDIAKITGNIPQGQELIAEMQTSLAMVQARVENKTPLNVYWEVWNAPYMSAGKSAYISEVIEMAGGKNIFLDIEQAYPVVSEESIILRKPDVIIAPDGTGKTVDEIISRAGWDGIPAVQNLNIYFLDADIISRQGPRVVLAVQMIAEHLFPNDDL